MKAIITLSILFSYSLYSQEASHLYKLAINEKDELVYIFNKKVSYSLKSEVTKERLIFNLLKDSMKRKKIALIVCTGEGKVLEEEKVYDLKKSRMCKDPISGDILYKDYDLSVNESISEATNIDLVLSQGNDFSELSKSIVDNGRLIIEEEIKPKTSLAIGHKNEAIAK